MMDPEALPMMFKVMQALNSNFCFVVKRGDRIIAKWTIKFKKQTK
jgi:hypothetical protein